jgi:hypothetical protein
VSKKKTSRSSSGELLVCPSCGRGHATDERFCADCGMPLVYGGDASAERAASDAHERARKIRPELTRGDLVRVAWARHQAEAELIQGILLEEGVPSVTRRSAGFDVPDFLAAGPRDVLVPESGVQVARDALSAADIPASPIGQAGPTRELALRIGVALLGGGALAALIAWALVRLAG